MMNNIFWEKGEFKFWILLLCMYHFFPFITTKGSIIMYIWAYVIPVIYISCNLKWLKKIISVVSYSEILISIICIGLMVCVSVMLPVLYSTNDWTYMTDAIMTMVKILIRMLFLVIVIVKHVKIATKETFMKYFIFSCCLYICSTVIMLLLPSVKEIFVSIVKESESAKQMALETRYSTRYGWGGFSGFEYTFKCVLAILFNNYLLKKRIKTKNSFLYIGISAFLLMGTLFYGRIGSLFGMIVMVALFISLLPKRPKLLMIVIVFMLVACVGIMFLQRNNESIRAWFEWAFDLFVTFVKTGKLQTDSSNVLLEQMLFLPGIKTILIGDGYYTMGNGSYYMYTDAGIMRPLLFGGIGFALLRYLSLYGLLVANIIKNKKEDAQLYIWILVLCIVFEIKGEIIFSCLPIIIWNFIIERIKRRNKDGKGLGFS